MTLSDSAIRGVLHVGDHRIDPGALRVLDRPELPRITPKAMAVLCELARRPGETLSRDTLLDAVWPDTCPTPEVLTQAIRELRRLLDDPGASPGLIETVPRIGYRLRAHVEWHEAAARLDSANGDNPVVAPATASAPIGETSVAPPAPASLAVGPGRWPAMRIAIGAALVLLAAYIVPDLVRGPTPRAQTPAVHRLTAEPGQELMPRVSPDGRMVAYAAVPAGQTRLRVHVRILGEPGVHVLGEATREADEFLAAWSPDGTSLLYQRETPARCELVEGALFGGGERVITDCARGYFNWFDWSPDGRLIAIAEMRADSPDHGRIVMIERDGLTRRTLPAAPDGAVALGPRFSPDGRTLAYRAGLHPHSRLVLQTLSAAQPQVLPIGLKTLHGHDWLPGGTELLVSLQGEAEPALFALDPRTGAQRPLGISGAILPSSARTAPVLAFNLPQRRGQLAIAGLDGQGQLLPARPVFPSTAHDRLPRLSADGGQLAFVSDRSGALRIWVGDSNGERPPRVLGFVPQGHVVDIAWHPDGEQLLLLDRGPDRGRVYRWWPQRDIGEPIDTAERDVVALAATADGDTLLLARDGDETHLLREQAGRLQTLALMPGQRLRSLAEGSLLVDRGMDGLRHLSLDGTPAGPDPVAPGVPAQGWCSDGSAVWVARLGTRPQVPLQRIDLATATPTDIGSVSSWITSGFDLDCAGQPLRLAMTLYAQDNTDIGWARLPP